MKSFTRWNLRPLVLFLLFQLGGTLGWAQSPTFEKAEPFYPNSDALAEEEVIWGFLNVPENWEDKEANTIKVAVCVLKSWSKSDDPDAVVFVQGGPGASGIQNIRTWLYHPVRETKDVVLMDVRGTGFSEPRLCPDLGEEFLQILAKDQSVEEDERQKVAASLLCKQDLLNRDIDIRGYHSQAVAKDLNTLKTELGYDTWNIYGVSYGTHMSQVYADQYPEDIRSLVLDSAIDDITTYYSKNTSNYMGSLRKVFEKCENDPECSDQYPDLEKVYYETIAQLKDEPLTVKAKKKMIPSGEFTYNAEDFKIAIQQALYRKSLIEIIPLLVYQFHDRNEEALGNLVEAFSSLLGMDYGVYYCVSCNEALPENSNDAYALNAQQYAGLQGGVSFYGSDFKVCDQWNSNTTLPSFTSADSTAVLKAPVLVFSGEFDPITPWENGQRVTEKYANSTNITGFTYGHTPSFTRIGKNIATTFLEDPNATLDEDTFLEADAIDFAKGISLNNGVASMGNSLTQVNPLFLGPLAIALLLMIGFSATYLVKIIRKRYTNLSDALVRGSSLLVALLGITTLVGLILALLKTSEQNFYVLAFGLPEQFNYLFTLSLLFVVLVALLFIYFIISLKKIQERSVVFSFIFSNMLIATYLLYWGIV
ncbi:alpha/beta fold hydrolase [Aureisphaera galaxeae]|uniref:alpha/beta fold hydrolase n=1 Tax=Aureisphaera galaxeae TaxID=1538023 RepID=UPI0023507A59|nr:alpha/beta fold hydrolase [Aureisphaera galaxeae]MDC8004712.1 alpha/beta fold hydrolase [Aureisphaera galaxeae]